MGFFFTVNPMLRLLAGYTHSPGSIFMFAIIAPSKSILELTFKLAHPPIWHHYKFYPGPKLYQFTGFDIIFNSGSPVLDQSFPIPNALDQNPRAPKAGAASALLCSAPRGLLFARSLEASRDFSCEFPFFFLFSLLLAIKFPDFFLKRE